MTDEPYSVKNGLAVVMNYANFSDDHFWRFTDDVGNSRKPDTRYGSDKDAGDIYEALQRLGFKFYQTADSNAAYGLRNATTDESKQLLNKLAADGELENCDCLVIVMASHGQRSSIATYDGSLDIKKELIERFSEKECPRLKRKPKLFFIQSCLIQGAESEFHLGENDLPEASDVFVSYSVVTGSSVFFATTGGSWLMQVLSDCLNRLAADHSLHEIIATVSSEVAKQAVISNGVSTMSQLRRVVRFSPSASFISSQTLPLENTIGLTRTRRRKSSRRSLALDSESSEPKTPLLSLGSVSESRSEANALSPRPNSEVADRLSQQVFLEETNVNEISLKPSNQVSEGGQSETNAISEQTSNDNTNDIPVIEVIPAEIDPNSASKAEENEAAEVDRLGEDEDKSQLVNVCEATEKEANYGSEREIRSNSTTVLPTDVSEEIKREEVDALQESFSTSVNPTPALETNLVDELNVDAVDDLVEKASKDEPSASDVAIPFIDSAGSNSPDNEASSGFFTAESTTATPSLCVPERVSMDFEDQLPKTPNAVEDASTSRKQPVESIAEDDAEMSCAVSASLESLDDSNLLEVPSNETRESGILEMIEDSSRPGDNEAVVKDSDHIPSNVVMSEESGPDDANSLVGTLQNEEHQLSETRTPEQVQALDKEASRISTPDVNPTSMHNVPENDTAEDSPGEALSDETQHSETTSHADGEEAMLNLDKTILLEEVYEDADDKKTVSSQISHSGNEGIVVDTGKEPCPEKTNAPETVTMENESSEEAIAVFEDVNHDHVSSGGAIPDEASPSFVIEGDTDRHNEQLQESSTESPSKDEPLRNNEDFSVSSRPEDQSSVQQRSEYLLTEAAGTEEAPIAIRVLVEDLEDMVIESLVSVESNEMPISPLCRKENQSLESPHIEQPSQDLISSPENAVDLIATSQGDDQLGQSNTVNKLEFAQSELTSAMEMTEMISPDADSEDNHVNDSWATPQPERTSPEAQEILANVHQSQLLSIENEGIELDAENRASASSEDQTDDYKTPSQDVHFVKDASEPDNNTEEGDFEKPGNASLEVGKDEFQTPSQDVHFAKDASEPNKEAVDEGDIEKSANASLEVENNEFKTPSQEFVAFVSEDKPSDDLEAELELDTISISEEDIIESVVEVQEEIRDFDIMPVMSAAKSGELELLKSLLESDPGTEHQRDKCGKTPFMYVCEHGQLDVAKLFIGLSGDAANETDSLGKTPLMYAANGGNLALFEAVLELAPAAISHTDETGKTPMMCACESGRLEIAKFLAEKTPKSLLAKDKSDKTMLMFACQGGNLDLVKFVMEKMPKSAIETDQSGKTALTYATMYGHLKVVQLLAEKMRKTVFQSDNNGETPMIVACSKGHLEVVKYLAKIAPNMVFRCEKTGKTPIMYACESGMLNVVELLAVRAPNAVSQTDKFGRTPITFASANGHVDVLDFLARNAVTALTQADKLGKTPIIYACENGKLNTVQYLVQSGVETSVQADKSGRTPFIYACSNGHLGVVMYLAKKGGRRYVSVTDKNGKTAMMFACENGKLKVATFLAEKVPSLLSSVDKAGKSPLIYASEEGHLDVVEFLAEITPLSMYQGDKTGKTPMMFACERRQLQVVSFFAETAPSTVTEGDMDGKTPLMYGAQYWHLDVVKFLVEISSDVASQSDKQGKTAMMYALLHRHLDFVKFLATKAQNAGEEFGAAKIPASHYKLRDVLEFLSEIAPNTVFEADNAGWTPMMYASLYRQWDVVKFLAEKAPESICKTDVHGKTPLMFACESGILDVAKFLVEKSPKAIQQTDYTGRSALMYASATGSLAVVEFLAGIAPSIVSQPDRDGWTSLTYACDGGQLDVVKFIARNAPCTVSELDEDGKTPIQYAQLYKHYDIVDELEKVGSISG